MLSSLPISIQSSLNSSENKVLSLLHVQDDLLSLLWMLKSLESRWIALVEPGLQCRVQSSLHTCALAGFCCAAASIAGGGPEALCAANRLSKHLFIFKHLPFPPLLLYLIQFHPTFLPFLLLVSNSCSYASLQGWNFLSNLFSATENFKKTFLILNAQSSAQLSLLNCANKKEHFFGQGVQRIFFLVYWLFQDTMHAKHKKYRFTETMYFNCNFHFKLVFWKCHISRCRTIDWVLQEKQSIAAWQKVLGNSLSHFLPFFSLSEFIFMYVTSISFRHYSFKKENLWSVASSCVSSKYFERLVVQSASGKTLDSITFLSQLWYSELSSS